MHWIPLLVIVILLVGAFLLVIGKFKNSKEMPLILLTLVYFAGISIILFTPISFDGTSIYVMSPGIGRVNKLRLYLHGAGFIENIILTIPLGLLLKKFVPQLPILVIGILGIVISSGIEVTQHFLSLYFLINRSTDVNDIIANALGIVIGSILLVAYTRLQLNHNNQ